MLWCGPLKPGVYKLAFVNLEGVIIEPMVFTLAPSGMPLQPASAALVHAGEENSVYWSEFISGAMASSDQERYFIGLSDMAMGSANPHVFLSRNGGETWFETGNPNDEWSSALSCGAFSDDQVGFLFYRYGMERNGRIYRTLDSGMSWSRMRNLEETLFGSDHGEVREVTCLPNEIQISVFSGPDLTDASTKEFVSHDNGENWTIESLK